MRLADISSLCKRQRAGQPVQTPQTFLLGQLPARIALNCGLRRPCDRAEAPGCTHAANERD